ncbi:MAG: hydroxymethylbilane synthase [Anaerolineales bacterium]
MSTANRTLRIGSRASSLAQWQTRAVQDALQRAWPELKTEVVHITTRGDRELDRALPDIGGKGLFTLEIEDALRTQKIDLAVHSLKDLPTEKPEGLKLGAIPLREDARDVLISSEGKSLEDLPAGSVIGTSSPRRRAQILLLRPDLQVRSIRGNVETRVRKVTEGEFDGAVLAAAGLLRLGMKDYISHWFSIEEIMPAPGQGAIAVQQREQDDEVERWLAAIEKPEIRNPVEAERSFLNRLESGCSAPVGAWAESDGTQISMRTLVAREDGQPPIRLEGRGNDPLKLGHQLAEQALDLGAAEIIGVR